MNVVGKRRSIENNKDVFGNVSPWNTDHVYPLSKGGTDCQENRMKFSKKSNDEKKDKTKGFVNDVRFSILKVTGKPKDNGDQSVYGIMYIKPDKNTDKWYEVVNG